MDGWNTTFILGNPIFTGYVTFREGRIFLEVALQLETNPVKNAACRLKRGPVRRETRLSSTQADSCKSEVRWREMIYATGMYA